MFYVWHWNFSFVVFTIILTRLISLSIIIFFLENIATCTIWGIAGLELPMKVVVSCDKLGVGADILWSQDCLMGLPKQFFAVWSVEDWEPTELKHLSRWRKRKQYAISLVTASENDTGQTESRTVRYVEMWCFRSNFSPLELSWSWLGMVAP